MFRILFHGFWCTQAYLSSPGCRTHDAAVAFRQILNTALCTEGLEERSAIQLCQTVEGCLPRLRAEAIGILINRMQSLFQLLFKYKHDSDARKWRWMRVFGHLCLLQTSCGKKFVSLRIISTMLHDLTRKAACEDISCLATFLEICGGALDSEPRSKTHVDKIFRILSKEIADAKVKKQFETLREWRLEQCK